MRLTFWGTRGAITTPGPDKVHHGANTACVTVSSGGGRLILDAGLGIVALGERLMAERRGSERLRLRLLLSHLHWDHLIGLPFFAPMFARSTELDVYGRAADELKGAVERLFTSTYSPIKGAENLGASLRYHGLGAAAVELGPFRVTTCPLQHPSGALAFRIEAEGKAVVYATDHEAGDPATDRGLVTFARGADVLIHDALWAEERPGDEANVGHSSAADAVRCGLAAEVGTVVLFHHHHRHSDRTLSAAGQRARALAAGKLDVRVARDGMLLELRD